MNINTFINDIDMHLNETKRMDCPVCNGKNTFTVSFINGVRVWNCYKASCSTKGNVSVRLNVDDIKQSLKGTVGRKIYLYYLNILFQMEYTITMSRKIVLFF